MINNENEAIAIRSQLMDILMDDSKIAVDREVILKLFCSYVFLSTSTLTGDLYE